MLEKKLLEIDYNRGGILIKCREGFRPHGIQPPAAKLQTSKRGDPGDEETRGWGMVRGEKRAAQGMVM
jgi:hypothetical protein